MQKFSSFGRKKKKQTKIRHRMVMLEGLQLLVIEVLNLIFLAYVMAAWNQQPFQGYHCMAGT